MATFGFFSKYQKGANVPTGRTQFRLNTGDLKFQSTSYEWLVIAGARAQFKGVETTDGTRKYGFMLTGIDGASPGGGGSDKFRIKTWDIGDGDVIVYDNQLEDDDTLDPTTDLIGGSIAIHTK